MDKTKFSIVYALAREVIDLKEQYESSHPFVSNCLNDKKVMKAFGELYEALNKQLENLRKN